MTEMYGVHGCRPPTDVRADDAVQARIGPVGPGDEPLPQAGEVVRVWRDRLRMLGVSTDALVLATEAPPFHLYLIPDANGTPGLMRFDQWWKLRRSGDAEVLMEQPGDAGGAIGPCTPAEKLRVQCRMLDAARVPNGAKAIAIYLHQHWGEEHQRRFGAPDHPNTLRRWRIRREPEPPA